MTSAAKRHLYLIFGILISLVLLWVLFRDIKFDELIGTLKGANYWWLIPNVAFIVLTMYQRAWRWHFMVAPIKKVPFSKLLAATCIGFMANNVLPLRLGEFVRAYSLASQDRGITKSASLATIFVERMVFDLVALLLIFGVIFWFSPNLRGHVDDNIIVGVYTAILIALIGIILVLVLALKPDRVGEIFTKYLFFLPERAKEPIKNIIIKFSRGLEFVTDLKMVSAVSLHTILIWMLMGLSNLFVFAVFGFDIPVAAAFVVLVVVSISILIPSSPGFVGVYHYGAALSLVAYGVSKEDALSCALVLHATQYIVVTAMGFYFLKKEHLSLKKLQQEASDDV